MRTCLPTSVVAASCIRGCSPTSVARRSPTNVYLIVHHLITGRSQLHEIVWSLAISYLAEMLTSVYMRVGKWVPTPGLRRVQYVKLELEELTPLYCIV